MISTYIFNAIQSFKRIREVCRHLRQWRPTESIGMAVWPRADGSVIVTLSGEVLWTELVVRPGDPLGDDLYRRLEAEMVDLIDGERDYLTGGCPCVECAAEATIGDPANTID